MVPITCFSTLGCPQLTLRQSLALARQHGLVQVEVRAISGSTDLASALASEFGQPAGLTDCLATSMVSIPVLGTSHRLWGGDFHLDDLEALAHWAGAAGAAYLRVFDGNSDTLGARDLDDAAERLDRWNDLRVRSGVEAELIVETHGTLCSEAALAAFCARFPDQKILWDTHHTWAAGNVLARTRGIIGRRLAHIHVKDSAIIQGRRRYVLPGHGAFPMTELRSVLASHEPQAAISLEWEALWHPELPPLDLALDHALAWP